MEPDIPPRLFSIKHIQMCPRQHSTQRLFQQEFNSNSSTGQFSQNLTSHLYSTACQFNLHLWPPWHNLRQNSSAFSATVTNVYWFDKSTWLYSALIRALHPTVHSPDEGRHCCNPESSLSSLFHSLLQVTASLCDNFSVRAFPTLDFTCKADPSTFCVFLVSVFQQVFYVSLPQCVLQRHGQSIIASFVNLVVCFPQYHSLHSRGPPFRQFWSFSRRVGICSTFSGNYCFASFQTFDALDCYILGSKP
jgi:hypothetical protein